MGYFNQGMPLGPWQHSPDGLGDPEGEVMAAITMELDLPPGVTIRAYQRFGEGHGFEVAWPMPSRCCCERCHHEGPAYLEYKNGVTE